MEIPLANRKVTIPGESGNVLTSMEAPADIVAAHNLANVGVDTSLAIVEANERVQERRGKVEAARKILEMERRMGERTVNARATLKAGGDDIHGVTDNFMEQVDNDINELKKDANPRILETLDLKFSEMKNNAVHSVSLHQMTAEYDYNEKTKEEIVLEFTKSASMNSDSPAKVMQARDEMQATLALTFPNGVVPEMIKTNADANLASLSIQAAIASEDVESAKHLLADFAGPLKSKGIYDELTARLKSAEVTNNENALYSEALLSGKRGNVTDWGVVKSYLFKPENREKYKMTPMQVAQISRVMDEQRQADQDGIYNNITAKAIQNPGAAMRDIEILMKNPRGYDAPVFRQLYESIKRGQQADVQFNDQAKMVISTNIMAGVYKDKNELTNAIFAAGITKGNDTYLKTSMDLFDKQVASYGQQNNFKAGEEVIDAEIRKLPAKNRAEAQRAKTEVMNAASAMMREKGVNVNDPQATKILTDMWDIRRKTLWQKGIEAINPWGKPSEPFVPTPTPGRPQSKGAIGRHVVKTKTYPDGRIKRQWSDGTEDWK
jgi:hypothetical protein